MKLFHAQDWHQRFIQQAGWTENLRRYLYNLVGLSAGSAVLEVGCGTGALLPELAAISSNQAYAIDINRSFLTLANQSAPGVHLNQADTHRLPYINGIFDISLCHFLLLWVRNPILVLTEMTRVTRPGGSVLIMAEPDYGARIDYPPSLVALGKWQATALRRQGADPQIGRKITSLMTQAGLELVETGVMGGQWHYPPNWQEWNLEWSVLMSDLQGTSSSDQLSKLQKIDRHAWETNQRILYVPTFYSWGRVPRI